jgi:hypothetical protein
LASQFAVGVSFDFEKIVNLINEKSRVSTFRSELAVCTVTDNTVSNTNAIQSLAHTGGSSSSLLANLNQTRGTSPFVKKKIVNNNNTTNQKMVTITQTDQNSSLLPDMKLTQLELKNRLFLYKQLSALNKNFNVSTHLIHEKFLVRFFEHIE